MRPVGEVTEALDAIQKVRSAASAFCTNFFPSEGKLRGWIQHGELVCEPREAATFFLRKDRGFRHLYFCAASVTALQRELASLPGLTSEGVVVDLVGTETGLDAVLTLFESIGFRPYTRLCRMTCTSPLGPQPSCDVGPRVTFAERAEGGAVLDLLYRSFDRYAEQIPMPYEIEAAIESRQILSIRSEGQLAALLFFEKQGFTSAIRYWLVAERFRARRFGSALMRHYFAHQSAVRRFILWVIEGNENAVPKYRHYGYAPDGLVDHVLANAMIRP